MPMTRVKVKLWCSEGNRILTKNSRLPEIMSTTPFDGNPQQIVKIIRKDLGASVSFLRFLPDDVVETEVLDESFVLPQGFTWAGGEMVPPPSHRALWQQPGWLLNVLPDVDRALERQGVRRTGPAQQTRHTGITGMLRLPTDGDHVWLKSGPDIFAHEARVVTWLSARHPGSIPTIVADDTSWWISREFPEERGTSGQDPLEFLASVHTASIEHIAALTSLGCRVLPPSALVHSVEDLTDRTDLLHFRERSALRAALPEIEARCRALDAEGMPLTLVHGDFHAGNFRWIGDRWFVYDWTDACVAHPFVDLCLPLSYVVPRDQRRRVNLYTQTWRKRVPDTTIERCLRLAPAVGAAYQVANYRFILDNTAHTLDPGNEFTVLLRQWVDRLLLALRRPPTEPVFFELWSSENT